MQHLLGCVCAPHSSSFLPISLGNPCRYPCPHGILILFSCPGQPFPPGSSCFECSQQDVPPSLSNFPPSCCILGYLTTQFQGNLLQQTPPGLLFTPLPSPWLLRWISQGKSPELEGHGGMELAGPLCLWPAAGSKCWLSLFATLFCPQTDWWEHVLMIRKAFSPFYPLPTEKRGKIGKKIGPESRNVARKREGSEAKSQNANQTESACPVLRIRQRRGITTELFPALQRSQHLQWPSQTAPFLKGFETTQNKNRDTNKQWVISLCCG